MISPDSGRSDAQICAYVTDWARRVQEFIAALPRTDDDDLDDWEAAFVALEMEGRACLNSHAMGSPEPRVVDRLLKMARETGAAFARALNIPVDGMPQAEAIAPGAHERGPVDRSAPVPIGGHVLPPLPYPYNALEPYIDERTMRLHHDRHHRSYVEGLNKAEIEMERARQSGDYSLIKHWEREAAFNGAGHYLHTLFWTIMSPDGGGEPVGALADQLRRDFGNLARFRDHFSAAAERVEGGGWAILVWAPRANRLALLTAEKHQNLSQWDDVPLLALDVWEHAYYLKYEADRKAYIHAWWNVVDWPEVARRYEQARRLVWRPA